MWNNREETDLFKKIKAKVAKRDGQCALCGSKAKYEIHHIAKWSSDVRLRYSEFNLCRLCRACHKKIKGVEEYYEKILFEWVRKKMGGK